MSDGTDDKKPPADLTAMFRFPSPPPSAKAADQRGDATDLVRQQRAATAELIRDDTSMVTTPGVADAAKDAAYRAQLIATARTQRRKLPNVAIAATLRGAAWGVAAAGGKIGLALLLDRWLGGRK